jgi:hypothetical protein
MNKRQWKKNYKKIHKCSPPSQKKAKSVIEVFMDWKNQLVELIGKSIERMKDMPKEEFAAICKKEIEKRK